MKKEHQKMDIRKHRFVPSISTTSKLMVDKKRKALKRQRLNDPKNWEV